MLNIMNPPADWSTLKKLIWLRGTPINGGEELTVSGTPPLSLPNSLGRPLKAWSVEVSPYQEGSGDPSPSNVRAIHGTDKLTITTAGKNLIQNTATSRTNSGVTYTVGEYGIITLSGTATATSWMRGITLDSEIRFLPAGQYHLSGGISTTIQLYIVGKYVDGTALTNASVQGGVYDIGSGRTFTLTQDAYLNYQIQVTNGVNADGAVIKPMIEVGTGTGEFTPYLAPSQTVLTLPQTVYTGTIGSEGGESRDEVVDLSTLTWTYTDNNGAWNHPVFFANVSQNKIIRSNSDICEKYAYSASEPRILENEKFTTANNTYVYIRDDSITNTTDFRTANAGVKYVYKLATSDQFPLPAPTIPTPKGTATTWATAEDGTVESMEVTYVGKA